MEIQHILDNDGLDLNKDFQMPPANYGECQPRIVSEELNFDSENLKEKINQGYPQLNHQSCFSFHRCLLFYIIYDYYFIHL